MTAYDFGAHCVYYHRYHVVWATKYRYKVLTGDIRERARKIIRQSCDELGVTIVKGVLARDHVHMFLSVPPKHAISDVMRCIKGRSSRRLQQEFPELKRRYWGRHFWARGYFCSTSGNITDDIVLQYLSQHGDDATGVSR
ncbi:MAG: IS200/IS605 family transposase [Rhodobacteraceae bacterium]|jgi:putative transposase|nr:IS200/IS605 family transposase [Paracoccaceae bacterium]